MCFILCIKKPQTEKSVLRQSVFSIEKFKLHIILAYPKGFVNRRGPFEKSAQ